MTRLLFCQIFHQKALSIVTDRASVNYNARSEADLSGCKWHLIHPVTKTTEETCLRNVAFNYIVRAA